MAEVLTTTRSPGESSVRQVVEAGVRDAAVGLVGDEQADAVAREAARLGRLVRLEQRRQPERTHADTPASSRAR